VIAHIVPLEKGIEFFSIFQAKHINHSPFSDKIGLVCFDGGQFEQPARERSAAAVLDVGGHIIRNRDVQSDFHKPTSCLSIHPLGRCRRQLAEARNITSASSGATSAGYRS